MSTCKCESKYVPMRCVCVCVCVRESLPPSQGGGEGRGREEWMDRGRGKRDCKSECEYIL